MLKLSDHCASEWNENDECKCDGVVYYGTWKSIMEKNFKQKKVTGSIPCTSTEFGNFLQGTIKSCYCKENKLVSQLRLEQQNKHALLKQEYLLKIQAAKDGKPIQNTTSQEYHWVVLGIGIGFFILSIILILSILICKRK